jgi:hypothetical protein
MRKDREKGKEERKNKREGKESWSCAALLPLPVGPNGPIEDDKDVLMSRSCPSL